MPFTTEASASGMKAAAVGFQATAYLAPGARRSPQVRKAMEEVWLVKAFQKLLEVSFRIPTAAIVVLVE